MGWLLVFSSVSYLGYAVVLVAQIACIVHVLKTGRPYWWIWIIFAVPIIGMAAYIYLEVRPTWRKHNFQSFLWNLKSTGERIRILRQNLEESTTIKNRLALADELSRAGRHSEECEVLADGLRGPFSDDAQLLLRLAEGQLAAGRSQEAETSLDKIVPERSTDFQLRYRLQRARSMGQQGRTADAEKLFRELVAQKKSEAPRYFLAELLCRTGRREEGIAILRDILLQYRRGTTVWRFQERPWFYAAKYLLKSPPTGAPITAPISAEPAKVA